MVWEVSSVLDVVIETENNCVDSLSCRLMGLEPGVAVQCGAKTGRVGSMGVNYSEAQPDAEEPTTDAQQIKNLTDRVSDVIKSVGWGVISHFRLPLEHHKRDCAR